MFRKLFSISLACGILCVLILGLSCAKYSVQGTIPQYTAVVDANRIVFFQGPIASNGLAANFVLGQPDFISNTVNNGGVTIGLNNVRGIYSDGPHLIVGDASNNRVLIWNSFPKTYQQQADLVLGQPSFTSVAPNWNGITLSSLSSPGGVLSTGTQLIVTDAGNNRLLIWKSFPTRNDQPADITIATPGLSLTLGGGKLFGMDSNNHRILVWNSIPTQNNQTADFVLGQPDLSTTLLNNSPQGAGIVSAYSLSFFFTGCSNGSNLVIGERGENRALIWKSLPSYSWQPADIVLGQPDFSSSTANNTPGNPGAVSAQALSGADAAFCDQQNLTVVDYNNRRLLIWKNYPVSNQQPADFVVGQPDMATALCCGFTTQTTFFNPGSGLTSNSNFTGVFHIGGY